MKRIIIIAVIAASLFVVPVANAASPTMAQFRALKAQVTTLKHKVTNLRSTVYYLAAAESCRTYVAGIGQYGGYANSIYGETTALDGGADIYFEVWDSACVASSRATAGAAREATDERALVLLGKEVN